jgi:hypothetical protein
VSGDSEGYIVLWKVAEEQPLKLFSITGNIKSIVVFGIEYVEALYVCADNKVLRVHLDAVPNY